MTIEERINKIIHLIRQVEISCHREPGSVHLLAVSKGQTTQNIVQAYDAGLRDFGESYLQEAQAKIQTLRALSLCWHFIGPIQSNKTTGIAHDFSWVHGVSRKKIAQRLNDARPVSMPPLSICIQVNFGDETSKAGINPDGVAELASYIMQNPQLRLRGLMLIPKQCADEQQQYQAYLRLTHLFHTVNKQLTLSMDTLSMGMSDDFQPAIRAGSTMVRVGRGIFGKRT